MSRRTQPGGAAPHAASGGNTLRYGGSDLVLTGDTTDRLVPDQAGARSVSRVISLGANTRNGGPQKPVPRLV